MKKIGQKFVVFLFLSILNYSWVFAQEQQQDDSDEFINFGETTQLVLLGIKAGGNLSGYGGDFQGGRSKTGFNSGIYFAYTSRKRLGFNLDIYFAQKGAKFESPYPYNGVPAQSTHYLDYVQFDLPVTLLLGNEKTKYKPFLGVSTSYLLRGVHEETNTLGETRRWDLQGNPRKIRDENAIPDLYVITLKKADIGGVIGMGLQREIGKNFLHVDIRYNFGATNIRDYRVPSFTNNFISINVGYLFALSKL